MTNQYNPDWVSPPGDTIADILEERCWTVADLASKLNCSEAYVNCLIRGDTPIFRDLATKLSEVLGSSVEFWLNREANYRNSLNVKYN